MPGWGRAIRRVYPGAGAGIPERQKAAALGLYRRRTGDSVPSVVSLRTSANSSSVPIVVFVDMQQEYLAGLRLEAISHTDCALDKCQKVLDHSRRIGLPVAFVRMINESAFFNRAALFVRWIEGFEPYRNEMVFERRSPSCYSTKISGIYAEVFETDDWIEQTLPRNLGYGKNAGG